MKAYLVMYDISNNKLRSEVIHLLKENGLYRIQKSVFLGATLPENITQIEKIFKLLLNKENTEKDKYIIIPLDENVLQKIKLLNIKIDIALYLGKKNVHFI